MLRGFRFLHVYDEHGDVSGLYAELWSFGAVDVYAVADTRDAVAARYRAEDYDSGRGPIWQTTGIVADVITALLALPPHGQPGAPVLARRAASEL